MIKLSNHFTLYELARVDKYGSSNYPGSKELVNLTYGVTMILEPLRLYIGKPIIINSGYRNKRINALIGGVSNSQHLTGCAADIRLSIQDDKLFSHTIEFLRTRPYVDQLLTAKNWCHVSWTPFGTPRNQVIENYYK